MSLDDEKIDTTAGADDDISAGDTQASQPSLTRRTAHGFAWMVAQTGTSTLIDLVAWYILGRLLLREEFGLISIAFATRIFTDVLKRTGLRQVLVQRHHKFNRWATPGFWLSLAIGLFAAGVMCASAPIVAYLYDQPDLLWLTLILAAVPATAGLSTVPMAKMQSELRFKEVAGIEFGWRSLLMGLRVGLAVAGLGAFACVIPDPVAEAARTAAYWWRAKPRIHMRLRLRRWRYLIFDSWWLLIGSMALKVVAQAPYFVSGFFLVKAVLGDYFFAFTMSIRALRLLTVNLENVLLPALSHIKDDAERQVKAYLRAACLLTTIAVPLCLLGAAVVEPMIHILYPGGKWDAALPVAQILCAGVAMWVAQGPTASLLKAQGRWRFFAGISSVYALGFAICVLAAAALSEAEGPIALPVLRFAQNNGLGDFAAPLVGSGSAILVALTVSLCMMVFAPIQVYVGIKKAGGCWRDVFGVFFPPMVLGAFSIGSGAILASLLPAMIGRDFARLAIIVLSSGVLYVGLLWWLRPATWDELIQLLSRFLPGKLGKKSK